MGDPEKPEAAALEKTHSIRWDADDWRRIEAAAQRLAEQEHDDVGPTNVIRRAVRRFLADFDSVAA